MDIPNLVRERLGDEAVEATISLGDEDLVCFTPTRTLVYRGEGLLSDESVSVFSHDVERLDISEGRRKTKFTLTYVDGSDSFTVPSDRGDNVLKLLLSGILDVAGVTDDDESVSGVFRFSELTLVVTRKRLVRHIGSSVFDPDYEEYPYEDVTGLEFEDGRVATQVVLTVDGRPERIKAPNDQAKHLKRTLTGALFAYHEVDSLSELNERLTPEADDEAAEAETGGGLSLEDDDIAPLVGDDDSAESPTPSEITADSTMGETTADTSGGGNDEVDTISTGGNQATSSEARPESGGVDPEEIDAMKTQLSELTTAVKRQNDLLRDQQETIEQLIEELRRGR